MASPETTLNDMQRAAWNIVHVRSGAFLARSAIINLLGVAAVISPQNSIIQARNTMTLEHLGRDVFSLGP